MNTPAFDNVPKAVNTRGSVNKLKALELVTLYNWLKDNHSTIPEGFNYPAAASFVEGQLNFRITEGNLRDAMSQLNLRLRRKSDLPIDRKLAIMKPLLEAIAIRLGVPLPSDWADL